MRRFMAIPKGAATAAVMYVASMFLPVAVTGPDEILGGGGQIIWGGNLVLGSVIAGVVAAYELDVRDGLAAMLGTLANVLFVLSLIDTVRGYHRNRRAIAVLATGAAAAALVLLAPILLVGGKWKDCWPLPGFSLGYLVWVSSMVLMAVVSWRRDARGAARGFEPVVPPPQSDR